MYQLVLIMGASFKASDLVLWAYLDMVRTRQYMVSIAHYMCLLKRAFKCTM